MFQTKVSLVAQDSDIRLNYTSNTTQAISIVIVKKETDVYETDVYVDFKLFYTCDFSAKIFIMKVKKNIKRYKNRP